MTWGIRKDWSGFEAVEIVKETAKMLVYRHRQWGDTRTEKQKLLPWRGDEETARSLCAKLTSADAEYRRREDAASNWYQARKAEIFAQGMAREARGREGGPGSSELPSPVLEEDAPKGESS